MRDMIGIFTGLILATLVVFLLGSGIDMGRERVVEDCLSMNMFRVDTGIFECNKISK